jgi:predicted ABC-type ATPase
MASEPRTDRLVRPRSKRPIFWLVAGPNGSGKSSLYDAENVDVFDQSVWIINPDILTERIQRVEGLAQLEANIQAVTRVEAWLEASINAHQTVAVETVLSTDKYRRLIRAAKDKHYEFRLIFIMLETPDLDVRRVRLRAKKGGHDVAEEKIQAALGEIAQATPLVS